MYPQIFEVQNERVIINEHVLSIPELKAVYEFYEDPVPALQYLRHMCDPFGPYNNLEDEQKEEVILQDFPGDYTTEDDVVIAAKLKLESLYMTPTYRYYLDNKKLLESVGSFARTTSVKEGRDGNYAQILSQLSNLGKTVAQFKQLEKIAEEELKKTRNRGNAFSAYDEDGDDDDD